MSLLRVLCWLLLLAQCVTEDVNAQVRTVPSLYGSNLWYGQNSSPLCVLTNGTTVSVNALSCVTSPGAGGVDLNAITLTQNSVFALPAGLPSKGNFKFGFRINHGTGPYTAQFASGYQFPSASLTGGQPALSTFGTDYVWCVSEEGTPPTTVDCNASMLAMTAVTIPPVTMVQHTSDGGSGSCSNGTNITTGCSVTISGVAVGDTLTLGIGWCNHTAAVDCSNSTTSPITSINSGCTSISGASSLTGLSNVAAYRCTGLSGTVVINPQWGSGAAADYTSVFVVEWSNDAGPEAGFAALDSASPFTITTGNGVGTLSQASGEAAYALIYGGGTPVVSSPTLALSSYTGAADGYQTSGSNAQVTNQFTGTGSGKLLTFALKHN